jgi:hypothetical protein
VISDPSTYKFWEGPATDWAFKPPDAWTMPPGLNSGNIFGYMAENFDRPLRNAETDERIRLAGVDTSPGAFDALLAGGAPPVFTQPEFDPTGTAAPYDKYLGMLEGLRTEPRTGRIYEMYGLGQEESRRRMETADAWEATQGERLDVSDEALDAALIDMQDKFGERLTTIREGTATRQAETADLRDGLIEATAGELGPAAAAFIVQATESGDILESQRSRNEQHMADMDGLFSMWSLDRTMDAAGMKMSARRDLADDVLAMREMVHEFDYGIEMAHLERLQGAEQFAAGQNRQLSQTLAQIGLTKDLAVQSASGDADDDWQRANAWLSSPITGWAFEGMTPEMVMGMSDTQMQTLYAQAVRESEQIEVAPGVFVDAESWYQNAGQSADPMINVGGAYLERPTTVRGVDDLSQLLLDAASGEATAALDAIGASQPAQGVGGGLSPIDSGLSPIDTSGITPPSEGYWLDPFSIFDDELYYNPFHVPGR